MNLFSNIYQFVTDTYMCKFFVIDSVMSFVEIIYSKI